MRVALQPALVLHRRPYRNTSLLVEALTQDYGRVGLVARGVRTARSRLKGLLQPFAPLLLSWSGKGDLVTLTGAEEAAIPFALPASRLLCGFYVNELLLRFLKRYDPHPGLFAAYRQVLAALAEEDSEEAALRVFEKQLLAELGYGLMLSAEAVSGAPIRADAVYRYVLDRGPMTAENSGGIPISGRSLLALQRETFADPGELREVKRLTRVAIGMHLEGIPLRTRELMIAERRRHQVPPFEKGESEGIL